MPAVPPYIIEPVWEQFSALLPHREVDHPLGCHRSRIPDRVVFEKLVAVLVHRGGSFPPFILGPIASKPSQTTTEGI